MQGLQGLFRGRAAGLGGPRRRTDVPQNKNVVAVAGLQQDAAGSPWQRPRAVPSGHLMIRRQPPAGRGLGVTAASSEGGSEWGGDDGAAETPSWKDIEAEVFPPTPQTEPATPPDDDDEPLPPSEFDLPPSAAVGGEEGGEEEEEEEDDNFDEEPLAPSEFDLPPPEAAMGDDEPEADEELPPSEFDLAPLASNMETTDYEVDELEDLREFRAALQVDEEPIGAEHGEGFINFTFSGPLHTSVDVLNEKLETQGAERIRQAHKPDEAYGMIFSWDGVIVDGRDVQRRAWERVAEEEGLKMPEVERPIYGVMPEKAIIDLLCWTDDILTARRLAHRVAQFYTDEFNAQSKPKEGVREWLVSLRSHGVPCALATTMGREMVTEALERMDLRHYFQALVTAEDGMDSIAHRYLCASIKLNRPPKKCVVFDATPNGVTAAHNCSMKAVAVVGGAPAYQLKQADLTCLRMSELSVYNVRRLFAMQGYELMDFNKEFFKGKDPPPPTANGTMDPEGEGEDGRGGGGGGGGDDGGGWPPDGPPSR